MGQPTSVLRGASGFRRDDPRDRMPEGFMWDMVDYVPVYLDAQLTGRGGWRWSSTDATPAEIQGGIYAPFPTGDRLLVIASNGRLYQVGASGGAGGAFVDQGALCQVKQNPVILEGKVYVPDATGAAVPKQISAPSSGGTVTITPLPASAPKGTLAAVWKGFLITGNEIGDETRIFFSLPDPMAAWDANSWYRTTTTVTALAGLRTVLLVFHQGSVERFRGTKPARLTGGDPGDLMREEVFNRAGCADAKSIAYWNDNCIFADERGCHITDGAVVKNLVSQGGITFYWRNLFRSRSSLAACTYLDYYIISVIRQDGIADTLVCDLNRRTWFRFSNIKATAMIQSVGMQENIWAGIKTTNRLANLSDCFFPPQVTVAQDADGTPILPEIETPWYRLTDEGRKRMRFVYTSYDVRTSPTMVRADRRKLGEPEVGVLAEDVLADALVALTPVLDVGWITSPNETTYTSLGDLPASDRYTRRRLPINEHPYGAAFQIKQIAPSSVTRVYDLAIEATPDERSRV